MDWPASSTTLQQAVSGAACVRVAVGVHELDAPVVMPSNHTLVGADRNLSILRATQATWVLGGSDAVIANHNGTGVVVRNLTLDAAGVATYAVGMRHMTVDGVNLLNGRCHGAYAGAGTVITGCDIRDSGHTTVVPNRGSINCATSSGGVAEGAGIYTSSGTGENFAPVITGNTITGTVGPALDVNGAWGGTFSGNTVTGNSSWAGVSLFAASNWLVANNTIRHPASGPGQPYHAPCRGGPAGEHAAAIFVCQDSSLALAATGNTIQDNAVSSFYGILSIGEDEVSRSLAPHQNTFSGNNVVGSNVGCADDLAVVAGAIDLNVWTNNNCAGTPDSPPSYF